MTIDWKNAPEGATHYTIKESGAIWFKNINGFWTIYDSGVWYAIGLPASDLIPRLTSTAIPELKKLTQAVFDGLPPEYQWAAVDANGKAWAFIKKPVCDDLMFCDGDDAKSENVGVFFDTTDWQDSKIEREPSVAEIVKAFAANPPNFDALINSVANAQTLAEAQAEIERLKVGHDRYEILRKLNVVQFQKLYTKALQSHLPFDNLVDILGGVKMKVKTSEASNKQLDWGVAKALELKPSIGRNSLGAFVQYKKAGCDFFRAVKHTDPDLCVWLIEQHGIASTRKTFSLGCFWECKVLDAGSESHYIVSHGKTLPEAVARCVIAMKLGEEFECPSELGVMS